MTESPFEFTNDEGSDIKFYVILHAIVAPQANLGKKKNQQLDDIS